MEKILATLEKFYVTFFIRFWKKWSWINILPIFALIFRVLSESLAIQWKSYQLTENEIVTQSRLSKNEVGPGMLQPNVQKKLFCKNTKGTKLWPPRVLWFCLKCSVFLENLRLLKARLEHSRSNHVFEILNDLFLECSVVCFKRKIVGP